MDDEKHIDTEQPDETAVENAAQTAQDTPAADPPAADLRDAEQSALWREGLVQEALSGRPELRKLATKKDFAASRRIGHDLGFEDGARKLTLDQLQEIGALKARRLASYAPHEMPGELRGYLDERSLGLDERGFLAGYVDGVSDFLQAYKDQLRRQS